MKTGLPRLAALLLALLLALPPAAYAADPVRLFKIVSPKDEVVVGLSEAELKSFGPGPELDAFAKHLAEAGQMTIWQYAVKHGDGGALQQAPLKRIAIFRNETLRIEPFNPSPLPVAPLPAP